MPRNIVKTSDTQPPIDVNLTELDTVDWCLLTILDQDPLWKSAAHDALQTRHPDTAPSVQTVGRRISALETKGLVEKQMVSPDDLNREVMIAFTTTPVGTRLLEETDVCCTCLTPEPVVDHVHEFVPAEQCFCADDAGSTEPGDT